MLSVTCYSDFKKRRNSTKRPTESGQVVQCCLKEDTSLFEPTFIMTYSGAYPFDYFKWGNYYYFLQDVVSVANNMWEVSCTIDVMATWKSDILNTSAYVLYSTNNGVKWLPDSRIPKLDNGNRATGSIEEIGNMVTLANWAQGTYVLTLAGLANGQAPPTGATQMYVCTLSQARMVNEKLMTADETIQNELVNMFGGQMTNAIISLKYFPIKFDSIATNLVSPVAIGNWSLGIGLGEPKSPVINGRKHLIFNKPFNDWRKVECCRYFLYLPNAGLHELDPNIIAFSDIWVSYFIDLMGGTITYIVSNMNSDSDGIIYTTSASFCAQLATTVYNDNKAGRLINWGLKALDFYANNVTSIALNMISPNAMGTKPLGEVFSSKFGMAKELSGAGTVEGFGSLLIDRYMETYTEYVGMSEIPSNMANRKGLPCCKILSLSNCSGYVQTNGISVSTEAPAQYKDMINSYLDGGAFIE